MAFDSTDDYIDSFPNGIKKILQKVRIVIQKAAPKAQEALIYGVPGFKQDGNLMVYAAFKSHLGIYPSPATIKHFKRELEGIETSKGAIRFPLDQSIPYTLIKEMVKHNLKTKNRA